MTVPFTLQDGSRVTLPLAQPAGEYTVAGTATLTPYVPPPPDPGALSITSLSPAEIKASGSGTAVWITVAGTGFIMGMRAVAQYYAGIAPVACEVLSPELLRFPSTRHSSPGSFRVYVLAPSGEASNALTLRVVTTTTPPPPPPPPPPPADTFLGGYRHVETLQRDLDALVLANPTRVRRFQYGRSACHALGGKAFPNGTACPGWPLYAYQVGVQGAGALIAVFGIHPAELLSNEVGYRWLEWITTSDEADAVWLRANRNIVTYLPASPDGLWIVGQGYRDGVGGYLTRKNAEGTWASFGTPNDMQARRPGTNLNRNFPVGWGIMGPHSSLDPLDRNYVGPAALSAPEANALRESIRGILDETGDLEHDNAIILGVHSTTSSGAIAYPWGHTTEPHPRSAALHRLASRLGGIAGLTPGQISLHAGIRNPPSLTPGCLEDTIVGTTAAAALLMEMPAQSWTPPFSTVETAWQRYKPLLIEAARLAADPWSV